ncbi:putative disease resistance RPP13-like protein 1 [Typha latifolia]|uniref:putative disease resistance RPP13-like protein 1 n=1 Tax=Typha latifolia TaxID=4733 RepID=UPI003C2D35BA
MPVGLTVGGWFASSIVGKLLDSLKSYATYQYRWQLGLEAERERLEEALPRIQALLDAVDSSHVLKEKNPALEEWMWQFRDAVEEAEDFMDEIEYYRLEKQIKGEKSKVSRVVSRLKTILKRAVHKDRTLERLKDIVRRLDKAIAGIGVFVNLLDALKHKQSLITGNRDTTSLLPVEHKVVGRGDEKHSIINKLLNFSSATVRRNFSILPIVGVGGIGKTTLAQFVYNDEGINKHFKKRMWVCVSNTFDVLSLTKKIYELVVVDKTHTTNNLDLLQREILESLRSKRILLVLDDVWNDDDRESWGKLLAPFSSVEDGSMILLTTRMERVAKMTAGTMEPIFLKGMGEEDYWEFFKNCAFGDEDPKYHNKLQDIGRKIAEKLKGSPLAAKTVGGILRTNLADEHWKNILNSEIWQLKQYENDIMPALGLSYQHLSSHLKPCFRFCSIFPQDYEFGKEELVYLWMALGLVQRPINGIRRPEDIGEEYLNELVGKSFFDCKTGLHTYYVMHDLLHELATSVSVGECFRIENRCEPISIPKTVRHLSINTCFTLPIPEITKLKYLRTLLLLEESNPSYCHIPEVLKGLRSLRVLESAGFYITDDCFSHLKHLRLLRSGSYTSPVFESLNKLYHLQFLYYQQNDPHSNKLYPPDFINNLINLRRLSTPNSLIGNVSGIGGLTSLQILDCFSVKKENGNNVKEEYGNNLFELKNLRELRELGIQNLQKVTSVEEVAEAKLNDKEHLQTLTLKWDFNHIYDSGSRGSPEVEEQVIILGAGVRVG